MPRNASVASVFVPEIIAVLFLWILGADAAQEARQSLSLKKIEMPSSINGEKITAVALSGNGLLALGTASGRVLIVDKDLGRVTEWRCG